MEVNPKGYKKILKESWRFCKSSWKCFENVGVCRNQRNFEQSELKATAAHFTANGAQRVAVSVIWERYQQRYGAGYM